MGSKSPSLVSVALPTTYIGFYTTGCFAKCLSTHIRMYIRCTYLRIYIITYMHVCI